MRGGRVPAALLALCLACGPLVASQNVDPADSPAWSENSEYLVEVNGSILADAHLYTALGASAVLVVAPELESPLMVRIQGRQVLSLAPDAVTAGVTPYEVRVNDTETRGPAVPFTQIDDGIIFYSSDDRVRIFRRPPIVGSATIEEILDHPSYKRGMDEYEPSQEALSTLRSLNSKIRIEVFFGSWCPHCKRTVPRFMKSFLEAGNPVIEIDYIGVPRPPFGNFAPARERNVQAVPVFIVSVEGVEVGRVERIPSDSSVEIELARILEDYK